MIDEDYHDVSSGFSNRSITNLSPAAISTSAGTYPLSGGGGGSLTTTLPPGYFTHTSVNTGAVWTNPVNSGGYTITPPTQQTMSVKGDATFEGDIKIKGKSLTDTLDRIEQRLGILHPNEELEEIWTELKELGDRYRELVKNIPEEIVEKKSVWDLLKK